MENHEKVLEGIQADITPIVNKSSEIASILTPEGEARGVEFLAQVSRRYKLVDEMRKSLTRPIKAALDNINTRFNAILKPLEAAEARVKTALSEYRQSDAFKALELEQASINKEVVEALREGDVEKLEDLAHEQALVASQTGTIHTESGAVHYRTTKHWKVSDLEAIPRNFLMPDEKAIKEAVKQGLIIPGIHVWEEKQAVIRT